MNWNARKTRARRVVVFFSIATLATAAVQSIAELDAARNHQDVPALERLISKDQQAAQSNPKSADAQYRLALAYSYGAEVTMELHDKRKSENLAQSGLDAARKAVDLNGANAEYHRILGALCGQVIPANPLFGALKYGQCAKDEIEKAIQLDHGLAMAYVSRGIGNYYLPAQMGGGPDIAIKDFDKAISIDPNLGDAYLWKGVALRKLNKDAEARQALEKASQLNPDRAWIKEQLNKTPAK